MTDTFFWNDILKSFLSTGPEISIAAMSSKRVAYLSMTGRRLPRRGSILGIVVYARDVLTALRRRWMVFVCGLLVTGGVILAVLGTLPSEYQATASIVFIPPSQATDRYVRGGIEVTNPFLNFSSAMVATSEVVIASINSHATATKLKVAGADAAFQVGTDPNSDAPTLSVAATSHNPEWALLTRNAVVAAIQQRLRTIQATAGAPTIQFVHTQTVTTSETAGRVHGSLIRALVVLIALGITLSCAAATFTENHRGRKSEMTPGKPAPGVATAPAPT